MTADEIDKFAQVLYAEWTRRYPGSDWHRLSSETQRDWEAVARRAIVTLMPRAKVQGLPHVVQSLSHSPLKGTSRRRT